MTTSAATLSGPLKNRDDWSTDECSAAKALEVVGTRSALLIMREAFYGTTRFEDFAHRVGISEPATATRLRELTEHGLFYRRQYQEAGQRKRSEYVLTDKGRDLLPVVVALMQWGDKYESAVAGGPIDLVHDGCRAATSARVVCTKGHDVPLDELRVKVSPNWPPS